MLKLKILAYDVPRCEVSYLASLSPCYLDFTFLSHGLRQTSDKLRFLLSDEIEKANEAGYYS